MFLPRSRNKFCFLETLETMLPGWKNWKTLGKHARATDVSGNVFIRFPRLHFMKDSQLTSLNIQALPFLVPRSSYYADIHEPNLERVRRSAVVAC